MTKVISRTPLRIGFVGGLTDVPYFYQQYGGACISTAIDKYITVSVSSRAGGLIDVMIRKVARLYDSVDKIEHKIVRECLRKAGITANISIEIQSDVGDNGTGLGTSSALTVGLLSALYAYKNVGAKPEDFARTACEIEINILGNPIGKQDQYIAAYGGFRRLTFHKNGDVELESIKPPADLESVLMLFDTGISREASKILATQQQTADPETLLKMKRQVRKLYTSLQIGDLPAIGDLLHETWKLKKSLAPSISNDRLDTMYRLALDAGAVGGKVLGAGGGGHLFFIVPLPCQSAVVQALDGLAAHTPFRFEPKGTRVCFD